jgi:guanosine-3',5'-bis(diphosphate) 3'-pyrophosphohydrolase
MSIDELIARVQRYDPTFDGRLLRDAYALADQAHHGQLRASGESYIFHPLAVAGILADLEMDRATLAAALLHDVVEDTVVTSEEVAHQFGDEIASLVDGVTKLTRIPYQSKEDAQVENLRKMFLAMARDIRVIIIKLADRLHNMRTLGHVPLAKQQRIARETLEIYAPLAHRLGIWKIKWDLEDLSLRYIEPEIYRDIAERVAKKRTERESTVDNVVTDLRTQFSSLNLSAEVTGRPKHFYSIYNKLKSGHDFTEIYDLIAVRVIVESVKDCYATLGVVHSLWKPLPGRFKDYIAMPKQNMYQSLHTTVIGPGGEPLEVQIRTREMHRTSEYGIAAHWRYKEGGKMGAFDEKLTWLRSLLEWQDDMRDSRAFMEDLKLDLFDNQVFVFSPKGDVFCLPLHATPLDFAYQVHSDIGNACVGVKVNGRIVPLDYTLNNGDICEVLTNKNTPRPSLDWLAIVKTSSAKHKIKQWFRKDRKEENVLFGQEALARGEAIERIARRMHFSRVTDLYAAIGFGDASAASVIQRIREELKATTVVDFGTKQRRNAIVPRRPARSSGGITIAGVDEVLVRLSKCCRPVPGDPIMGYVTIGKGVSVHRADCPNIAYMNTLPERILQASWNEQGDQSHAVDVELEALDRAGLLQDIMAVCAEQRTNASSVTARVRRDRMALISLTLEIRDLAHLHKVLAHLGQIRDVRDVYRVTKRELRAGG